MYARTVIQDFSTANKLYIGATVTLWKVLNGEKTAVKADVYKEISGGQKLANPQVLDGFGKFRQPVYIQDAVIMTVEGIGNTPDHDTGVVGPVAIISGTGSPQGAVTAPVGTLYLRTDGGTNTTLYVKESGTGNTGWVAK